MRVTCDTCGAAYPAYYVHQTSSGMVCEDCRMERVHEADQQRDSEGLPVTQCHSPTIEAYEHLHRHGESIREQPLPSESIKDLLTELQT